MVMTKEMRESILQIYSDMHKDAYGFRNKYDPSKFTDAQLEFEVACMEDRIRNEEEIRIAAQAQSLIRWKARIAELMATHAISRADAIRWDMQAYGDVHDVDRYAWVCGLDWMMGEQIAQDLGRV